MKIHSTQVTKLLLTELASLDPISVILEDLGPSRGKITITCFGSAWTAVWGGMGDNTISQFFTSCNEHYLAGKLSSIHSEITDYGKITTALNDAGYDVMITDRSELEFNHEAVTAIYGDEWWRVLPEKPNPDYQYLCRIILAVQQGIKNSSQSDALISRRVT